MSAEVAPGKNQPMGNRGPELAQATITFEEVRSSLSNKDN
jgi:hypothetical protein